MAAQREYVSKDAGAPRGSAQDFPDLAAPPTALEQQSVSASFEVRLQAGGADAGAAVDNLATTLAACRRGGRPLRPPLAGPAECGRARPPRDRADVIVVLLAVASALTVANVVRLAAPARQDEIEIMQLVGAPFAYVRGPFVVEGILQGGTGALLAVLLLWALFAAARARYGQMAAEAIGLGAITFLPFSCAFGMVLGGMLLGCVGGFVVAAGVGAVRPRRAVRNGPVDRRRVARLHSFYPFTVTHARSRMARVVSPDRVLIAPVGLPSDFYREEFIRHRECLARQREYFSERAITDADQALARGAQPLEQLCAKDDAEQLMGGCFASSTPSPACPVGPTQAAALTDPPLRRFAHDRQHPSCGA